MPGSQCPPFCPPPWFRNPHAQTLIPGRLPRLLSFGWNAWEPIEIDIGKDGRLTAEASWQPGNKADFPALILLHGLEGSARSHYMIGMSKKAFLRGFHAVRVNMRNCGGTEHLTPTLYCAGLSEDIGSVMSFLQRKLGIQSIFGVGVSLGANMLLKFLGESKGAENGSMSAAAALSPPIDLAASAKRIDDKGNWIYRRHFVSRLIERVRRKQRIFPGIADMPRIERIRTIYEFDDLVTAPHFGYGHADDYYRLASAAPLLKDIRVPTLIVQAKDDPMIPFAAFRTSGIETNRALHLLAAEHGGHTGFLMRRPAQSRDHDGYWAESRIIDFLSAHAQANRR
jgi:predicted alpha/beta-fold hydrolase